MKTPTPLEPVPFQVLILYSTVDGHALHICEYLQARFIDAGFRVSLREITAEVGDGLANYDLVLVGASIRYGFHRRAVRDFMRNARAVLQGRLNAFFSINLVARKAAKGQADTNPYLQHFLRSIGWQPEYLEVFAGRLDYPRCKPLDRLMIRLIMGMTGGPTDPATVVEYTDWQRVDGLADTLIQALSNRVAENPGKAPS